MNTQTQPQQRKVSEAGKRMLATTLRAMMSHNQKNLVEHARTKDPSKQTIAEREALQLYKSVDQTKARASSF
jgi:hypothetical protein